MALHELLDREPEPKPRSLIIAARGRESLKAVNGRIQKAIPFFGADRPGDFSSVGVGVVLPEENQGLIWGLAVPHNAIQSWRGMKILESVDVIGHGTLCAAWYAGGRQPHTSDQRYIDELAGSVGEEKFTTLRASILEQAPSPEELRSILSLLRQSQVEINSWELQQEVEAGRIAPDPLIDDLIKEDERKRAEYLRKEAELKLPLPRENSLAALLSDLRLDNFITGGGFGAYGLDWGHIDLEGLERSIRRLSTYSDLAEPLQITTQTPATRETHIAPGVTAYETETEDIIHPTVSTTDGTHYTFTRARFAAGTFTVSTIVQKPDSEPEGTEFTVPQLRELLDTVIQNQKLPKSSRLSKLLRRPR